ncbi:MAG TPA: RNA-binding cell elongation regulator Jag/EloR [Candidatus Wallbacteria bacterium]|nr:RNA-binding cell elongation regulator Jag/EloR [Candidatus Wallbacteria bacterium]
MRFIEKTAKTKDMAIEEALRELNASRDRVIIEILEEEKEGVFGIFGARPAKIRVTLKEDKKDLARELLESILKHMNVPCTVKLEADEENQATLLIDGENVGNVIGKRGSTLNAIQYLLNVMVNKEGADKINVSIDASGYRESRVKSLEELSLKLAQKVKETNRSMELEPMTSQERKIIHMTLKNNEDVYTYSKGEEPYRKVVISAKNKEKGSKNGPPRERGGRDGRKPRDQRPQGERTAANDNRPRGDKKPDAQQHQARPEPTFKRRTALDNIIKSNDEARAATPSITSDAPAAAPVNTTVSN